MGQRESGRVRQGGSCGRYQSRHDILSRKGGGGGHVRGSVVIRPKFNYHITLARFIHPIHPSPFLSPSLTSTESINSERTGMIARYTRSREANSLFSKFYTPFPLNFILPRAQSSHHLDAFVIAGYVQRQGNRFLSLPPPHVTRHRSPAPV